MQLSLKYSFRHGMGTRSVANFDEVVGQLRYRAERLGRLDIGGVVRDEEGLLGLDDDETFLALFSVSVFILVCVCAYDEVHIYLLRLQCVICRLDGHILIAVDLDALQDHLFRIVFVCKGVEDDLKFGLGDLVSKSVRDRMVGLRCPCGILVAWAAFSRRGWTYGEAWGGCPFSKVAHAADDGFVDVACADKAKIVD
jgi:hypothetical protein